MAIAFTPQADALVAVSQAGIHKYSWPSLERQWSKPAAAANLLGVSFSPDGRQLAVVGGNPSERGVLQVLAWPKGKSKQRLRGGDDVFRSLVWLDDKHIAAANADRSIHLWSLPTGKAEKILQGHSRPVDALCHLPQHKMLVSAGVDQSLRVWSLKQGTLLRNMNQHTAGVHQLAVRPRNAGLPLVASAAADRTVRFWQPTIGRMVRYARLSAAPLDVAWHPDGNLLAAACDDGKLRLIDPESVEVKHTLPAIADGWAYAVAAHPNDGSVAVGGTGGIVVRLKMDHAASTP